MKLDIEDNSLRELLQKRKEYIGGSWVGSVGNIIAGISLALTVYSSGFPSNWVNISLYLLSAFFTLIGAVYLWKQTGNRAYNYMKLDIENPIIRINTAFKGCSSLEKISVLPRIYHN